MVAAVMQRLHLFVVLSTALVACRESGQAGASSAASTSASTPKSSSSLTGSTPPPPPKLPSVAEVAASLCDRVLCAPTRALAKACSDKEKQGVAYEYLKTLWSSTEFCKTTVERAISSNRYKVPSDAAVQACVTDLERSWRVALERPFLDRAPACKGIFAGTQAKGDACSSELECNAGLTCSQAGTCQPPAQKAAECIPSVQPFVVDHLDCASGLVCETESLNDAAVLEFPFGCPRSEPVPLDATAPNPIGDCQNAWWLGTPGPGNTSGMVGQNRGNAARDRGKTPKPDPKTATSCRAVPITIGSEQLADPRPSTTKKAGEPCYGYECEDGLYCEIPPYTSKTTPVRRTSTEGTCTPRKKAGEACRSSALECEGLCFNNKCHAFCGSR